jgi:uracil-DNA glycosylase family 4
MGFFADGDVRVAPRGKSGVPSTRLLHELGCRACPLNHAKAHHPKMAPVGAHSPLIYILGGQPSEEDDLKGAPFAGPAGQYLRAKIPGSYRDKITWDNVTRDRSPGFAPDQVVVECCRPNIIASIEAMKPKVIFGFGDAVLRWATGKFGIANWRGRVLPVKIGSHECWFFPFEHPADLLRMRATLNRKYTEDERMFDLDLKRAFAMIPTLPAAHVHTLEEAMTGIECIYDCTEEDVTYIEDFLAWAGEQPTAGYDYETNGLRPYAEGTKLLSVAISSAGKTLSFPLEHPGAKWTPDQLERVYLALIVFLQSRAVRKRVHNLAFELEWTGVKLGRELIRAGRWDDTMSQAFILDQRVGGKAGNRDDDDGVMECFGLGFLTQLYFGVDIKTWTPIDKDNMERVPLRTLLPYNGMDAKYHDLLGAAQERALKAERLWNVYEKNHLPRVATTVLTQMKGIPVNFDVANELAAKYDSEIERLAKEIAASAAAKDFFRKTGKHFNPASNPDMIIMVRDILQEAVGEKKRRDKTGKERTTISVDEKTLTKINNHVMPLTLDWRGNNKLRSTYCFTPDNPAVWPDLMLHPLFNTVRARTARLTSSDPNFQNIPKRDVEAKRVREQFAAYLMRKFLAADYGQIEARVFAMASKDKVFTKMLWEDYDVHAEWARRLALAYPGVVGGPHGLNDKAEMKKLRDAVKSAWVFALFFGASLATCSNYLSIPEHVLEPVEREFWRVFSGLKDWQERNGAFYKQHGYVQGLTGRRRCGPLSMNQQINTPIQLTAAEIVMDGMCRISELDDWELQPVWNIHDDLGFHFLDSEIEQRMEVVAREMVKVTFDFVNVPLVAEISVGDTMYGLTEIGKISSKDFGHRPPPGL